ncbi:glycosyltransferase family A protein [Luteimonas kalidii]|uniref:Glycosyltransferase family A protein n=1 Tax=Luteimonas kalidii TaxID=3042025 RepID=A0ABT6JXK9_9GAMM|nr:glycosyltransferase family A protein [Luteimonas kalidii]MDH5835434.1 glycosyltransferase family A protein [Luteimonas kalidii]
MSNFQSQGPSMSIDQQVEARGQDQAQAVETVLELERRLEDALASEDRLKRRLAEAQRKAKSLAWEKEQILRSTSWRITGPLRKLRTMLGASEPVGLTEGAAPALMEEIPAIAWGACLPSDIPEAMVVAGPETVMRSNDSCIMLRPEALVEDVLPTGYLQACAGAGAAPLISFGDGTAPRIAFLGSLELALELAFDAEVERLDEHAWMEQLDSNRFAFLLIEPVWHVENRGWRDVCSNPERGRRILAPLVAAFRARGIPAVIWFRNPLPEIGNFGWMVELADRAYAIDEALAQALAQPPAVRVGVLAPAIQPAIHNPFRRWPQLTAPGWKGKVLYDGWLNLSEGLAADPLLGHYKGDRLLVGDSRWDFGGVRLTDQAEFIDNAIGCLNLPGKAALAKMVGAELFKHSPLTPAWAMRTMMMRSIACGAVAATTDEPETRWGGLPLAGSVDAVTTELDALLGDPVRLARTHHLALRALAREHCLSDRLDRMATDLGLQVRFGIAPATVACLLVTMRPDLLRRCVERFRADRYPHKELVIVLHGWDAPLEEARKLIRDGERISVHRLGREHSLGTCLNFAASQTEAEYWAKIDDDDLYGPEYLSDMMLWRKFADFHVGGKTAAFTYSQGSDEILFDPALALGRSWQRRVAGQGEKVHIAGGTLIGKREVLAAVPFSDVRRKGSDTNFLRRADAAGYDLHGFDFFNFALFRSSQQGFHTWNVDHEQLRNRTTIAGRGEDVPGVVFI